MERMLVTEYYTKFIELSRFAKEYVATEKEKATKLESGLTTDLQLKLCGQVFETLDEVYGRAAHLYALEEKKKKELAEIEGREKRKEVGQVSGSRSTTITINFTTIITSRYCLISGATFSFVSKGIVSKLKDCLKTVEVVDLPITIPTGGVGKYTKTFRNVPLEIEGKIFPSDLIEFGLSDFDLILGMGWLSKYNAEISCRSQKVKMVTSGNESVTYQMNGKTKCPRVISVLKLAKYMKKGHPVYFCSVRNMNHEQVTNPENIEVVNEFLDVFPEEITGMPPKRAIDFTIDLVPGTAPISKAPYRMAPAEISELKEQLQDLLEKGYIRPSTSWAICMGIENSTH
ncbi:uncharacterized protein LOC110704055 [Chenopodium quinoa]|uniref:uncharacterized protein LOC110704055 n=1 Tax=Chenopodium quinoa TaxID=63459 RepID=UPI000B771CBB|nr:uncharacterized protein LOC110704055 [Chenopodium quinoa]